MYRSPKTQDFYVLANDATDATLRQWRLVDRGGKIGIEQVRDIKVGSQAEGCAADDEFGDLYVGEEDIRFLDGLDTELSGNEEISIVPAIAGGSSV